ncbi:hypothetical protein CWI36_0349p0020 [Hamiltosporidium magnivora]|uniref:Uncharacterized protein n=1 Tax=Hamiltosporidium magnivora TaxID=148818 RepID=A0A4Q9LG66_9MICR|nr:hypothetical protein CWI36_0349p0020 [Hamiltosporidium magnivora]
MTGNDIVDNLVLIIMHARSMKPTSFLTKKELNAFIKFHYPNIYNMTNYNEYLKKAIKTTKNVLFDTKRRSKAVRKEILKMKKHNVFSSPSVQNGCHLDINIKEQNDVEERKMRIRKKIKMYREIKNQGTKSPVKPIDSHRYDSITLSKQSENTYMDIEAALKTKNEILKDFVPSYDSSCKSKKFKTPSNCVSDTQNVTVHNNNFPRDGDFSDSLKEIIYSDDPKYISPSVLTNNPPQIPPKYNFPVFYLNDAYTRTTGSPEKIIQDIQLSDNADENNILSETQLSFDQNDPIFSSLLNNQQECIVPNNLQNNQQENIIFDNLQYNQSENIVQNNFQNVQPVDISLDNSLNKHQEGPSNNNVQKFPNVDTLFNNINNEKGYQNHHNFQKIPQNNIAPGDAQNNQIQDSLPVNSDYNIVFNYQSRPTSPKYINLSYGELKERFKRENKFF